MTDTGSLWLGALDLRADYGAISWRCWQTTRHWVPKSVLTELESLSLTGRWRR